MLTDAEIVLRVRAGDTEAYSILVERHRNAVYGLAFHLLHNFEDARDVAQDVFVRAYLQLDQLREPDKLAPWLRRMTANLCRMQRRKSHVHQRATESEDVSAIALSVTQDHSTRLDAQLSVRAAMRCLSPASRLTLTLFYIGDYSINEIAAFLDVPITTIKSRLRDARLRLRKEMQDMVEETLKEQALPDEFAQLMQELIQAAMDKDGEKVQKLLMHPEHGTALLEQAARDGHFQRFTEPARRVCLYAMEAAAQQQSAQTQSEHLLHGLTQETQSFAAQLLREANVTVYAAQQSESQNPPNADDETSDELPELSPAAKRVLEIAASEAESLAGQLHISSDIGTEHILLALINDEEPLMPDTLSRSKLDSQLIRGKVKEHLKSSRAKLAESTP